MRPLLLVLALAGAAGAADYRPFPVPKAKAPALPPLDRVPVGDLSPAGQVRLAAFDLATRVRAEDRPYTRYVSLYDEPSPEVAGVDAVLLDVAVNTASQGPAVKKLPPVPRSGGYLRRLDLRWFRWTRSAFSAVARRDPAFTDRNCPLREAEALREAIGVPQDPATLSVEAVVTGSFLIRAILQPDGHGPTYYDLLYAEQRFGPDDTARVVRVVRDGPVGPPPAAPKAVPWPGGVWPGDGQEYQPGEFEFVPRAERERYDRARAAYDARVAAAAADRAEVRLVPPGKLLVDFPRTGADFEAFWGARAVADDARAKGRLAAHGEVVAGARNSPRGSYVAANDRAFLVRRVGTGYFLETFDTDFNVNQFDYLEDPLGVLKEKLQRKAGELLANLDNGLQAALLVNGDDARVEAADARIARNTFDRAEPVVLTQIGCLECHAPHGGYISPSNRKLRESLEAGLKLKVYTADQQVLIEAFFLGWEEIERGIRDPYEGALRRATADRANPKGWTGAQLVGVIVGFRDRYDAPVRLDAAARMLGVPPTLAFLALQASPTAGLNLVATDQGMPRAAWDATGWAQAVQLVELLRPVHSLLFQGAFDVSPSVPGGR